MTKKIRECWAFPWNYKEGLAISIALLIIGLALDFFKFETISFLYPNNIIFLIILLIGIFYLSFFLSKYNLVKFLSSIQASILAILLFVLSSVFIAIIPQGVQNEFIPGGITRSWTYHLVSLYMLLVLGLVSVSKIIHFRKDNLFFIFNHWGLWIVLFFASTSSYNIEKLNMYVNEEETIWYAFDENNNKRELDFAIKLNDFDIDEYNPKLACVNNISGEIIKSSITHIKKGDCVNVLGNTIEVKQMLKESIKYAGIYRKSNLPGAAESALISCNGKEAWISSGSYKFPSEMLNINNDYSLVMLKAEPKRFFSNVRVYNNDGVISDEIIEVNKPIKVKSWFVYQKSYNKDMGRWSQLSVFEIVRDPYLWMVYLGCFLMILGSFALIFKIKSNG